MMSSKPTSGDLRVLPAAKPKNCRSVDTQFLRYVLNDNAVVAPAGLYYAKTDWNRERSALPWRPQNLA
jgi:hypothetical protein